MTARDLFEAIGKVDEELIEDADAPAQPHRPKLLPLRRLIPVAACLCLAVGAVLAWRLFGPSMTGGLTDARPEAAQAIQEETGGELFSIQVTDPYPSDWDVCLERANEERGQDARPALVEPQVENLDSYDTVFLGYPNWWYGVPMALLTFLEENDLSGKDVYLFCSHGTGGLARSVEIITEAAPEANISDNIFDCYEEDAPASQGDIQAWVAELGLSQPQETTSIEMEESNVETNQISVTCGDTQVVYELNDSSAAQSLLSQLPLTVEVEDFSTNEKVFYPPQELDTSDTPLAEGGAGTLAYYAPWGDVVLFYDSFSANGSLYELGEAVSGVENIGQMSGTITVETVE